MKKYLLVFMAIHLCGFAQSQEIILVPHETTTTTIWEGGEKEYYSKIWQTQVVTNVSVPTMEVFRPINPNGAAVIIAPGGGLYALSIQSEGTDVAKWLNQKGITAFVLKYRLVPTGEDGVQEITEEGAAQPTKIMERVSPVLPLSVADGLSAISYVRKNAKDLNIDGTKIGFMGFSAGGAVTMGVAYGYSTNNRPDFLVPVYAWTDAMPVKDAPKDAPPMFLVCATDDSLGLANGSIQLYESWHKAGKKVGLQMYAKGGHGFGMRVQGLPSDTWIERFYDWSIAEGITPLQVQQ